MKHIGFRMAVGQLLDYSRFVDHANLAVLLPEVPRRDLLGLLHSHSIAVIAPRSDSLFKVIAHNELNRCCRRKRIYGCMAMCLNDEAVDRR